jgi:acyl dehydratase
MDIRPRDRFSSRVILTPEGVADFAKAAGDNNPIHYDEEFAASTRFGRPIASGTQTTSLMLGLSATHFSEGASMIGLEFWMQFRRPIFSDETIDIEWMVIKVSAHESLAGDIVDLRGRIRGMDGKTAIGAKGRVLVTQTL